MTEPVFDYPRPVSKLLTIGDVRTTIFGWRNYLALGLTLEHVPDLIRMALDEALYRAPSDSPVVWAPIHAWRALGQLQAGLAVKPLLSLLKRIDEFNDDWVGEDLPVVFGQIGEAALEPLSHYLADSGQPLWARVAAISSFAKIGQYHPDLRDRCVAALTRQLEQFNDLGSTLNGYLISYLVDLQAVEAAPLMAQAFAANRVDINIQGDWEDTQIRLGLLSARLTPKPRYGLLEQVFAPLLEARDEPDPPGPETPHRSAPPEAKVKTKLKARTESRRRTKARAKAKRKQQKKARQQSRQRK